MSEMSLIDAIMKHATSYVKATVLLIMISLCTKTGIESLSPLINDSSTTLCWKPAHVLKPCGYQKATKNWGVMGSCPFPTCTPYVKKYATLSSIIRRKLNQYSQFMAIKQYSLFVIRNRTR